VAIWGVSCVSVGAAGTAQKIIYRLKWLRNASVAGDLMADAGGFFADQGLQVTIKPGGPERNAIRELELGLADMGVASADQVILAVAKGAPVTVVAQLFQINPLAWLYRGTQTRIRHPSDLKGLTIGVTFGGNDETVMRTLMAMGGLDEADVRLFGVRYDATPFLRGRVALWPVYRNAYGLILADHLGHAGQTAAYLDPGQFGIRFVANSVVTHPRTIQTSPERVAAFVRALQSGWRHALDEAHEQETVALIRKFDPDSPPDLVKRQLAETRRLVIPNGDQPIGRIDAAAWQQTETVMATQGVIDHPVGITAHLDTRFLTPSAKRSGGVSP